MPAHRLLIIINVDWYFLLHWVDRARAAVENGYDVHVAMGITDDANRARAESFGLTVHPLPLIRKSVNPFTEIRTYRAIGRVLRDVTPDIVHTATIKPNIYGGMIAKRMALPVVASVPGLGALYAGGGRGLKQRILDAMYRSGFAVQSGVVFFENRDDMEMMVSRGIVPSDRARKIAGSGVDTSAFDVSPEPATPPLRILFAARLLAEKGLDDLIAAVVQLRDRGHAVELNVAGIIDHDVLGAIPPRQLEAWNDAGTINWLGQRDDMPALMRDANAVCLPTRYGEGIPRVLIEGAASARALVATDVAGCREIVRDGESGLLVTPGSVDSLRDALERLATDGDLRARLGAGGRRLVETEYAREIVIEQTLSAYAEL